MHILCLGINHHTAGLDLRERMAFSEESLQAALARLGCGRDLQPDHVNEMVILSTCNRVEIYALAPRLVYPALVGLLAEIKDLDPEQFQPHLYQLADEQTIDHLLRVAAGLDSLVLGEPQILGQVTHAFELARGQGACGPVLSRLFRAAIHAGKRARTETAISHNQASISSLAVRLAASVVPLLASANVLVLGAGEMAELAVEALRKRGVDRLTVANRNLERAHLLADHWGARATTFERMAEALQEADILITSTGAPHTLIHPALVQQAMQARPSRPLVIVDIAVPRDVDPQVAQLSGVHLFDLDSLHLQLEHSLSQRAGEVPKVERILAEEMEVFKGYLASLEVIPLIADMRQRAESIRQAELNKTLRHLSNLSEEERRHLEALTAALVKKLLHAPIHRLRAEAGQPSVSDYASIARSLFDL